MQRERENIRPWIILTGRWNSWEKTPESNIDEGQTEKDCVGHSLPISSGNHQRILRREILWINVGFRNTISQGVTIMALGGGRDLGK